jgi:hypothetical protein
MLIFFQVTGSSGRESHGINKKNLFRHYTVSGSPSVTVQVR